MKTPCLVLEGVDNSGEFLRFWAQHEYLYWRDVWLESDRTTPNVGGQTRLPLLDNQRPDEPQPAANAASAPFDGRPRPMPIADAQSKTGRTSP